MEASTKAMTDPINKCNKLVPEKKPRIATTTVYKAEHKKGFSVMLRSLTKPININICTIISC